MEENNRTLDLSKFLGVLLETKNLFFWVLTVIIFITVIYSLTLKNIYRAEAILLPASGTTSSSSSANETASQLASLAGISIGQTNSAGDKGTQALKILESRDFIINFLKDYELVPFIFEEKSWNSSKNILNLSNDYDVTKKVWVRNEPSDMQTYREFMSNHLKVVLDVDTGFVSISVDHLSPHTASMILNSIISGINNHMKERDLSYSNNAIDYLTNQLTLTNVSEVRNVFANVIEDQIQTKMLANISDEYILRVIDPPRIPDRKFKPRRSAIVAVTFALTFFSYVFFSLILFIQNKKLVFQALPFRIKLQAIDQE